jgi:hypothetical protein
MAIAVASVAVMGTPVSAADNVVVTSHSTGAAAWTASIGQGMQQAASAGKDTLIWFSGSGWNAASDVVAPTMLSEQFTSTSTRNFTLVRADFPAGKEDEAPVDPKYTVWAERLGITSLPAVVALDSHGVPYGQVIIPTGDAAVMVALVRDLHQKKLTRDEAFATARQSDGADRARHLHRGLETSSSFAAGWYAPTMTEIVSLDPTNDLHLKEKYQPLLAQGAIDRVVQNEIYPMLDAARFPQVIERLDRLIADVDPSVEQRQLLMAFKAQVTYSNGNSEQAIAWLDEAAALSPKSSAADRIAAAREQIASEPVR